VKNTHRLDYASLAEILGQKGIVEAGRLKLALQTSQQGPIPFPEVLVGEGLIGDWELSRAVAEIYGLPFLPADFFTPPADVLKGLDPAFLRQHRIVPFGRFGQVLTVCMPALVPAEVLGLIGSESELHVMPVVGTVNSNNRWLAENLAADAAPEKPGTSWSNLFDEGDAAVLLDLTSEGSTP
jgi:hypothetical protein